MLLFCGVCLAPRPAFALFSLYSKTTLGFYRDSDQRAHYPLYYGFHFTGVHAGEAETQADLSLSNDLSGTDWKILPSQLLVSIPLADSFAEAPYRRTRLQLGRQFFAESFELTLLDGVQVPFYWTASSGCLIYGGSLRTTDLVDTWSTPLGGVTVFSEVLGAKARAGLSARGTGFAEQAVYASVLRPFATVPLSPTVLVKGEMTPGNEGGSQFLGELQFVPADGFVAGLSHSIRSPKRTSSGTQQTLYQMLASSAQRTEQVWLNWEPAPSWNVQALVRSLGYNSGFREETGSQQELSLTWTLDASQAISPVFGHLSGYGGELWDAGVRYQRKVSERFEFLTELSAARLDKINAIQGWAYQLRGNVHFIPAQRMATDLWVEVDRNPLFDFDARVIGSVTFFH